MRKFLFHYSPLALGALVAGLATAQAADAAVRGGFRSVQGPRGHGYIAQRSVNRVPGATTANRSLQTNSGRGFDTTRQTTYGDGALTNQVDRTYNNGATASRTGSVVKTGDGSVSIDRSHTGVAGNTQSEWSTIYRTDDGVGRTRNFSTSNGRSAAVTGDVSFNDGTATVNRTVTTGSGASATSTRTYTRGD